KAGQDNYCLKSRFLGVNRAGAYSTHVLVTVAKCLVDAGGIDASCAATLACSALTAYSASAKLPALGAKDRVAVIGCGGVGLVGISVLRAKGVKNIVACDIDEAKLAAAARLGAKTTLDTRSPDAAQKLQGVAGAIDFVGSPVTAALGIAALRKGGRYVLVGLYGGELAHPLPPIAQRAIGIVGSYVGSRRRPRHRHYPHAGRAGVQRHRLRRLRHRLGRQAAAWPQCVRPLSGRLDTRALRRRESDAYARLECRQRSGLRIGVAGAASQ